MCRSVREAVLAQTHSRRGIHAIDRGYAVLDRACGDQYLWWATGSGIRQVGIQSLRNCLVAPSAMAPPARAGSRALLGGLRLC